MLATSVGHSPVLVSNSQHPNPMHVGPRLASHIQVPPAMRVGDVADRDSSRGSGASTNQPVPKWPLRRAASSLGTPRSLDSGDQIVNEVVNGNDPVNITPSLKSTTLGRRWPSQDQIPSEIVGSKDPASNVVQHVPCHLKTGMRDTAHARRSTVDTLNDRLGAAAEIHSADVFALLDLQRTMLSSPRISSSRALGIVEEPSWVETLKKDMQAMFKNELAHMFEQWKEYSEIRAENPKRCEAPGRMEKLKECPDMTQEFSELHGSSMLGSSILAKSSIDTFRDDESTVTPAKFDTVLCRTPENFDPFNALGGVHQDKKIAFCKTDAVHRFVAINNSLRSHRGRSTQIERDQISGVFAHLDTETIKERVRMYNLKNQQPDVKDLYHESGFFQSVAKHHAFDHLTLAFIVINAIWMSVDADLNEAATLVGAHLIYVIADVIFYIFFTFELFIRFMAFKTKVSCLRDSWFIFDSALVVLNTIDPFLTTLLEYAKGKGGATWPTSVFRLLRLARLSRMTRILKSCQELMIMIKGMMTALATVGYTSLLLSMVTYVFAVALRSIVQEGSSLEKEYFPNVWETMHYLFIHGTFMDDLSVFIAQVRQQSIVCWLVIWLYVCLAALLIMNMLIGIMCEVISAVAVEEREILMIGRVKDKFQNLLKQYDIDEDGNLSWDEFANLIEAKECQDALKMVDVDPHALVDVAEDIFVNDHMGEFHHEVPYHQFIELVLDLRGSQAASVKDVMMIGRRINSKFGDLHHMLEKVLMKTEFNSQ